MLLSMKDGPLCTSILLSRRAVSILYAVLVALPKRAAAFLMCKARSHPVPTAAERAQFRRSLDSATSMVFHQKTGLPLTSSPVSMLPC
uniref:Putative secreted protein n=1 Tax=Ixodes ricinus TaxID=34613 RepID=A0A6B0U9B0_IXORI